MADLDWASIAVAWVLSLVTTIIIIVAVFLINRRLNRKKAKMRPRIYSGGSQQQDPLLRHSAGSGQASMRSEVTNSTQITSLVSDSHHGSTPGGRTPYQRVPSREMPADPLNNNRRRLNDAVSRWCVEHNLPEAVASCLRDNGFVSKEMLDSLKPDNVAPLALPTMGQECQLRKALEEIQSEREKRQLQDQQLKAQQQQQQQQQPAQQNRRRNRNSSRNNSHGSSGRNQSSSTDEGGSAATTPLQTSFPSAGSLADRTRSGNLLEEDEGTVRFARNLESPVESEELLPPNGRVPPIHTRGRQIPSVSGNVPMHSRTNGNVKREFNGLVSDRGLYEIADGIGFEWKRLGLLLNISKAELEQFQMSYPSDSRSQIYQMLRTWRDKAHGDKEQVKAELHDALQKVNKHELAARLMREQVTGSQEYLNGSLPNDSNGHLRSLV